MYNPKREEEILRFWNENKIFEKTLEKTKDGTPFVFYDGPPFATGLPHFGHVLPTTVKDVIPRYQTMKGRHVPRIWGWDCHGLPIENLVEKKLGLKNKKDIEDYGVEKFNIEARNSVLDFADEWKKIIPRLGRWVDMDNDYRTMDPTFTESVWWSFKTLFDKNLAYEGFKVMHFCPHCGTVLSNFEVGQGYKDITDISVYVMFPLNEKESMLVWTTTPWTLPGNVALAVNQDVQYVKINASGKILILAKERLEALAKILGEYEIIEEMKGSDLIGHSYTPPFSYYASQTDLPNHENGWKIYGADFVTTTDGTGVVHIASAFGEDDLNLGNKEKLPFIQHVGQDGRIKDEVGEDGTGIKLQGLPVKPKSDTASGHQSTDIEVIKYLAAKDVLFSKEKLVHSYPHCWRCDTPLLNYATSSWFIKVTDFKDKLIDANKRVSWNPAHVGSGRFGNWLENIIDWGISRSRYWGAPLPIWKSENGTESEIEVIGSLDELRSKIKKNNYFVIRHGEADHNVQMIMSSLETAAHHVTEKGRTQVMDSAKKLKDEKIDIIIASPLLRTRETADIVAKEIDFNGKIIFDARISEEHFGDLDGKSYTEFNEFFKKYVGTSERAAVTMPNGESLFDIRKRVGEFLYEIDKKYEGKNILLVTHYGIVKMMEVIQQGGFADLFLGWDVLPPTATGSFIKLDFASLPHNEMYELDLHRPYIDEISWKSKSGNEMRRIKDVFDTWYDSGSMPFASKHYPFENKKEFEEGLYFPADFIAEGLDQTRGWFYSLLVMGIGVFGRAPYNNVIVNGTVLAEDGRKLSKRFNNYPPLVPTIEKYGADSLRYFLASSPAMKAEDVSFSEKALDEIVKKHFNRLYNVLSLFEMYSSDDKSALKMDAYSKNPLDIWIIALLQKTCDEITRYLDSYELDKATKPIGDFIEDLSTWYIRRSRDRFKSDEEADRNATLSTTRFVLLEFSKLMAPFIPFIAEDVFMRLRGEDNEMSVHLCSWPQGKKGDNEEILKQMEEVRKIVTLGLELRTKSGIKVRQPLGRLMIREDLADIGEDEGLLTLIKDELNVKEVIFDANIDEPAILDTEITAELQKEGIAREVVRAIQESRKEKGLQPGDEIQVVIRSASETHHIVSEYKEMITKVASVTDFLFEEIDDNGFEVRIV